MSVLRSRVPLPNRKFGLKNSKTILLHGDHDVFRDGTVMINPEARALGVVPTFEFNTEQSQASRAAMEQFMKERGAQLWIQRGILSNARLKKSPEFCE